MKRLITPMLIVFVLLLSACGGPTGTGGTGDTGAKPPSGASQQGLASANKYINCPASTNTTAAASESGTVTLNVTGATSSPAEDNLVRQNLAKFEQEHPNIKVVWSTLGDYVTKMRANVAAGNVADVFYLQPSMSPEYISTAKMLNLTPYMERDKLPVSNYHESLITPFTCKDGQVYGLPKDWNSLGVFYNKTMFQAAGVPLPTDKWTWDDMRSYAKQLSKPGDAATATYGITLDPDASRWGAFLYAAGGSMLNEDGSKAAFNNQAGIDSLTFYTGFQKDGSSVMPTQVSAGWAGDAFGKQRAAMALEGGWLIPYLAETYPDVEYDIAPLPLNPATGKRANLIYTNAWGAYGGTKHPDAAWQLIKYMTGENVQRSQLQAGFALPSIKSLANDPYFASHPGIKIMFDSAAYGYADNYGPKDGIIHDRLRKAIEKVILGQSDVAAALKEAEGQINTELEIG